MFGKMSAGILTIDRIPDRRIKIASTINVYGRSSAIRTIHMAVLISHGDSESGRSVLRSTKFALRTPPTGASESATQAIDCKVLQALMSALASKIVWIAAGL